jgi:hypothetical protein
MESEKGLTEISNIFVQVIECWSCCTKKIQYHSLLSVAWSVVAVIPLISCFPSFPSDDMPKERSQ